MWEVKYGFKIFCIKVDLEDVIGWRGTRLTRAKVSSRETEAEHLTTVLAVTLPWEVLVVAAT
jgi:hypothetical protein